jgi:hypothetical protein
VSTSEPIAGGGQKSSHLAGGFMVLVINGSTIDFGGLYPTAEEANEAARRAIEEMRHPQALVVNVVSHFGVEK